MTEPSQPLVVPPSIEGTPPTIRPLKKKARISAPVEPSEPQPPTTKSQIPSGMTPERDLQASVRAQRFIPSATKSMTTHRVGDPTIIHFTIDGRHVYGADKRSFARGLGPDIRGILFGPHHLIMAALLYVEDKVHRKKLLRADAIPLLFPRLLYQILGYLGYPSEP
ncbi:hypothetical protein CK203_099363 [Vitis vinifera]|uniref:Uncharacterized protein n=1 Tax=Vitis vinifera TaxID=29760 RepID=A0A438CHV8_VITVI|nr:hypothetical protein CK203_099363 [Vitis vinifera]